MAYYKREEQPFNMAIASLMRLDGELQKANFFSAQRQQGFLDWMNSLNNIYRELYPYIMMEIDEQKKKLKADKNEEELKTYVHKIVSLRSNMIQESQGFQKYFFGNGITGQEQGKLILSRKSAKFFDALDQLHRELVLLMYAKGLIMPPKEDPRFAFSDKGDD